ncbi:MAG: protoglobin domain-containing protein [Polyangiaceae bacterium]
MARETIYEELKRYVRLSGDDSELLASLRPHAGPHFERIAREFYERAREHDDAMAVFTGEEQVRRLQGTLVRWMERLLTGPHDEAYFQETAKIGRVHVKVGLPQRYMFTAMALIRRELSKVASASMGAQAMNVASALDRAIDLELAVMLETYRDAFVARIQKAERRERAEVDRALARMEHRYTQAVELSRVLVIGLDQDARIRMMNREAERVTGHARDEALGGDFVDLLLPERHRLSHGIVFRKAARGEALASDTLRTPVLTRAGKTRDVEWQLAYSRTEADEEVVLFAIGRDTTDEDALAARVLQSEKLAAVGTLAAGLAHEIRNPLNGAKLHVTFLERGLARTGASSDMVEALRTVRDEIARLSGLVTDFLDFARPRENHRAATSIRTLCERAAQVLRPESLAEGVQIRLDLPTYDIVGSLDAGKMEQVILNLVRNAIESTGPAGGGTVTIRMRREGKRAVLEVEDDGPGISEPSSPIFDPFFSTKPRGTGLGLSIVHRIVADHGGTITYESQPGHTVFRIVLPIERRAAREEA